MGAWQSIDEASVLESMPTDMAAVYADWVGVHIEGNADRTGRLAAIIARAIMVVRAAVESNPLNSLDPDTTTIPAVAVDHAYDMILFRLGMEMGVDLSEGVYGLNGKATIWLRSVQKGEIRVVYGDGLEGSPAFSVPSGWRCREWRRI